MVSFKTPLWTILCFSTSIYTSTAPLLNRSSLYTATRYVSQFFMDRRVIIDVMVCSTPWSIVARLLRVFSCVAAILVFIYNRIMHALIQDRTVVYCVTYLQVSKTTFAKLSMRGWHRSPIPFVPLVFPILISGFSAQCFMSIKICLIT